MVVLKIVQVGDPVLRGDNRELTPEEIRTPKIQQLVELMRETMYDAPGVGLAAPQIGAPLRLAVIEDRAESMRGLPPEELARRERVVVPFHVIVNPVLTIEDPAPLVFHEGCLSVSGFVGSVSRARGVRVDALDHRGEPVLIHARGWHARILQHEIDHLNGHLYVDRMDPRTFSTSDNYLRHGRLEPAP
ncbi:peptide deformylase [Myxococcota bacterium]|nr:peptide deformylase [Myxococcota bacterium]